jgi:hypothetical protein
LSRLRDTDFSHHLHGIAATLWLLLLLTQTILVRQRLMSLHQALGRASLFLAPVFVVSGLLLVKDMAGGHNEFQRLFGARLGLLDIGAVVYFAIAYGLALHWRRRRALHARLMFSTALLAMPPVLARIVIGNVPGVDSFETGFQLSYVVCELITAGLLLSDWREGEPRAPYAALIVFFAIQQAAFVALPGWAAWTAAFAALGAA